MSTGLAILGQTKKDDLTHKLQSALKMKPSVVVFATLINQNFRAKLFV
jgi:hypothetical protein